MNQRKEAKLHATIDRLRKENEALKQRLDHRTNELMMLLEQIIAFKAALDKEGFEFVINHEVEHIDVTTQKGTNHG